MLLDIQLMFDRFSDIGEIRAVILTGEGKVFCAGADIKGHAMRAFAEKCAPVFARK